MKSSISKNRLLKLHVKDLHKKCKKLTPEQIADIHEMHEMNCTLACIAEEVGCSISTVWYYVQSPETRKRVDMKRRKRYLRWQRNRNMYRHRLERYQEMYEKGELE